ncbi:MAG: DNA-binding transcriptional LysR family regulator [Halioglobus sp.]|jgi:DNA-binding transcriptional LysR family regulator
MDWSHLEYFLAVARAGSLSGAAKRLQVNHTTVARRLDKLEQQLKVRLFDRLSSGYRLTEDGLALEQQALQVEKQVKRIPGIFSASEADLSGSLKISKPSSAVLNLAPMLAQFHRRYPNIELELRATGAHTNISQLDADVAIRLTNNPPEDLIGRRLGRLPIALYGSEAYFKKLGSEDPAQCDWIVWEDEGSSLTMEADLRNRLPDVKIALRTNSYNELYEAVNAGMGVGLLPPLKLPGKHKLRALTSPGIDYGIDVWLLSHPDLRKRERVNAFKRFIGEQLERFLAEKVQ